MARLDEVHLEHLLEQLKQLRSELGHEIESLHENDKESHPVHQSSSTSTGPLPNDLSHSNSFNDCQERIRQVEDALHKIDLEFYGYCEQCFSPVTGKAGEKLSGKIICEKCRSL